MPPSSSCCGSVTGSAWWWPTRTVVVPPRCWSTTSLSSPSRACTSQPSAAARPDDWWSPRSRRARRATWPRPRRRRFSSRSGVARFAPTAPASDGSRRRRENMTGFKNFILRGNLVELAVAFVMATAFAAVVKATVDLILGIVGKIGDQPDFSLWKPGGLLLGVWITAVITFLIMAAVVYFVIVKPHTVAEGR